MRKQKIKKVCSGTVGSRVRFKKSSIYLFLFQRTAVLRTEIIILNINILSNFVQRLLQSATTLRYTKNPIVLSGTTSKQYLCVTHDLTNAVSMCYRIFTTVQYYESLVNRYLTCINHLCMYASVCSCTTSKEFLRVAHDLSDALSMRWIIYTTVKFVLWIASVSLLLIAYNNSRSYDTTYACIWI
jgi:hypothetical protein